MEGEGLTAAAAMTYYNMLNKIKPLNLRSRYPFIRLDRDGLIKTLREIELTYQHTTKTFVDRNRQKEPSNIKHGGAADSRVTVYVW